MFDIQENLCHLILTMDAAGLMLHSVLAPEETGLFVADKARILPFGLQKGSKKRAWLRNKVGSMRNYVHSSSVSPKRQPRPDAILMHC